MTTRTEISEERPVRIESAGSSSPTVDPVIPTKVEDEEDNAANDYANDDLENNEAEIWKAEKAGEGYFVPIHIWCASVIFPLCAGSFGPMTSAFGICALAGSWRVENVTIAPDRMLVGTEMKNPKW
jgi:potassium channel subfamily K